jgi:NAD(P)-dependent dehydrogenase (short-subunit alcohol dehydrogenase family)
VVLGGIDVLVCSAGVDRSGSVETCTVDDWDRVFAVNLRGVFLCAKATIPYLRAAGGGVIVIIASQMGLVAQPDMAAYCASKAGAIHLARAISVDHARDGIRANAVCPGPTLTPLAEARWSLAGDLDATRAAVAARQLHGRITMPTEIADAVWYLASPGAASVLGTALVVDGGYTAV